MVRCVTRVVMSAHLVLTTALLGSAEATTIQQKAPLHVHSTSSVAINKDHCTIPGLYGTFPREIGLFIQNFATTAHTAESHLCSLSPNLNKLMLYGPPGNGKTELAKAIAELTNSTFKHINSASVVGTYQNSGAITIEKYFAEAEQFLESTDDSLVIFFDEIDALGVTSSDQNNAHMDTIRAMETLWQRLSDFEREPRIRFIFASNNITKLPKAFLNRFHTDLMIEIKNPTLQERKEKLHKFLLSHDVPLLNKMGLKRCFNRLKKHGLEKNKDYENLLASAHKNLLLLDKQLRIIDARNDAQITHLVEEIAKQLANIQALLSADKNNNLNIQKITSEALDSGHYFCQIVGSYTQKIKKYLSIKNNPDVTLINTLAEKTNGLSVRALLSIASSLNAHVRNHTTITPEIINALISKAQEKLKLEEEESNRKNREEETKELQFQELKEKKNQLTIDKQMKALQLRDLQNKKHQEAAEITLKNLQLDIAKKQSAAFPLDLELKKLQAHDLARKADNEGYDALGQLLHLLKK